MPSKKKHDPEQFRRFLEKVRQEQAQRQTGYRERALALFPNVCARCGREFSGKNLRELTVHHKDNDHMNNPPDGSNWELLCIYCHDDEHQDVRSDFYDTSVPDGAKEPPLSHNPFQGLKNLMKPEADPIEEEE